MERVYIECGIVVSEKCMESIWEMHVCAIACETGTVVDRLLR